MERINEMLSQLEELSDEQISELESSILSEFDTAESQELTSQVVDTLETLANAVEAVRTEQSRRTAMHEELTAKAAEAAQRVRGNETTDAEDDPAAVDGETGTDDEAASKYPDTPVDQAPLGDEVDEGDTEDTPADPMDDPDEERKRRARAVQPPAPALPSAATASTEPAEGAELAKKDEDDDKKKLKKPFWDSNSAIAPEGEASVVSEAAEASEASPPEAELSAETPSEAELAAQDEAPTTDSADAPPAAEASESTEATTTEESPEGAEAAGESEGTTVEAPAEADNSIPTSEEPVTTPVAASGSEASLEIEAPADRRPLPTKPTAMMSITAGADIPGISAGAKFDDMEAVAEAFTKRLHSLRHVNGGDGEQHIIASMQYEFPESRKLEPNDAQLNTDRIFGVTSAEAITAAAGICLPLETRYDMQCDIGVLDRPIRDSLARFGADRGGIRWFNAPVLTDMAGATGFWRGDTNGQNWATYGPDGTTATSPANLKPCLEVQCTSEETAYIEAVTLCLTFNNLTTRVFPELIKRHNELALVAHARIAENHLLAQLEAGSTAVDVATTTLGAAPELFNLLGRAIAAYRHKNRMNSVSPIRMLAPMWLMDLLRADLALRMPGDGLENTFGAAETQINAWMRARNVNVTWHIDGTGPSISGTNFTFPTTVEFGLWAEGTWLYLDGGTLDLGVIRDSSLVATNQYKQFVETFEGLANMGCDSFWVSAPFEACGSAAALVETCA